MGEHIQGTILEIIAGQRGGRSLGQYSDLIGLLHTEGNQDERSQSVCLRSGSCVAQTGRLQLSRRGPLEYCHKISHGHYVVASECYQSRKSV